MVLLQNDVINFLILLLLWTIHSLLFFRRCNENNENISILVEIVEILAEKYETKIMRKELMRGVTWFCPLRRTTDN
jgi:hypothetical protein